MRGWAGYGGTLGSLSKGSNSACFGQWGVLSSVGQCGGSSQWAVRSKVTSEVTACGWRGEGLDRGVEL